ncbi:MAG TPA: hypothetical protein VE132_01480 [Micromonosporaceae bacterium]|nr:hypothetical protein [Micromonosporaceae bacterium]
MRHQHPRHETSGRTAPIRRRVRALAHRSTRELAGAIAATLALGGVSMIAVDIAAPGLVRHVAASAHFHAQVLVERLQWILYGFDGDDMAVAGGIVIEMVGTVALIMLAVGWAERRTRRVHTPRLSRERASVTD